MPISKPLGLWAAALCIAAGACAAPVAAGGELHYGLTLAPSGIDPHVNASSELGIPLASVYDTLVYRRPTGGFIPGLAQRWTVSDDGRTYTFTLRPSVKFQDGTPFNAQAVKVNLDRIMNPATKSQKAVYLLGPLETVEAVDDLTVRLTLAKPYAPLLDGLSQVYTGMASPAALAKWGTDYQFHQVGTGPFRFVDYVPADHLTLERNPDYAWGPSIYQHATAQPAACGSGCRQVERVVFRFYTDPATRAPALLSGDADVMGEVLPLDAADLAKRGGFSVIPVTIPGEPLQFFFNTRTAPTDDPLVRQALVLATDRTSLVRTVFGAFSPIAVGPLTQATWGAVSVTPAGLYDAAKAGDLLAQAGWADANGDGIREKDGQPLAVQVVFSTWGLTPQTAEVLEMQWQAVGVRADLVQVPTFSALMDAKTGGKYNLISWNQAGTDPDVLRSFYRSDAAYNLSGVQSAELDRLLDDAGAAVSDRQRLDDYRTIQEQIGADWLLLPIRDYVNLNVANSRVQGLEFMATGWYPQLIDVWLEH